MRTYGVMLIAVFVISALLAACQSAPVEQVPPVPPNSGTDSTSMPEAFSPPAAAAAPSALQATSEPETALVSPAWYSATLTDTRTGQPFSINDFSGQVVLVETIAVWCTKCKAQQVEIQRLHELVGDRQDLVSVSIDVDPFEDVAFLAQYLAQTGFTWRYAVAPPDVAREIAALYGDQFLNPPSTPILIIDRRGQAHPLRFGLKDAEELLQSAQPYLDQPA